MPGAGAATSARTAGDELTILGETRPLSRIFADLARFWADRDQETSRSLAALFDAFWEFGEEETTGESRERLRNALCYDYCLAEYPAARQLPRFFPAGSRTAGDGKVGERGAELARRLGIGRESRVRTFACRFDRDPRRPDGVDGEVCLLFVYITTPGSGLEVRVLDEEREAIPRTPR